MLYGFYFDPTYILIIIGMALCLAASAHVNSTFNKYSRVKKQFGNERCSGSTENFGITGDI